MTQQPTVDIVLEGNDIETFIAGLEALNKAGRTLRESSYLLGLARKLEEARNNLTHA